MELRRSKELSKGGLGTKLKRSGRKLETREEVKAAWTGARENMEEIREVLKGVKDQDSGRGGWFRQNFYYLYCSFVIFIIEDSGNHKHHFKFYYDGKNCF